MTTHARGTRGGGEARTETPAPRRWGLAGKTREATDGVGRPILSRQLRDWEFFLGESSTGWPGADWRPGPEAGTWTWSPGGPLDQVRSFRDIRAIVASGSIPPGFSETLDRAAIGLVEALDRLHRAGFGAGLIQGDNVVFEEGRPGDVILLDAGFTFGGIVPPNWPIGDDVALWDTLPHWNLQAQLVVDRERHPALLAGEIGAGDGFDPRRDLRSAARLLAWALQPARADRPDSGLWRILDQVTVGDDSITTAGEFSADLRANPPSEAMLPAPRAPAAGPRRSRRDRRKFHLAAAVLALVAAGAVVTQLPRWIDRASVPSAALEEALEARDVEGAIRAFEAMAGPGSGDRASKARVDRGRRRILALLEQEAAEALPRLRGMTPADQHALAESLTARFARTWAADGSPPLPEDSYPDNLRVLRDFGISMQRTPAPAAGSRK